MNHYDKAPNSAFYEELGIDPPQIIPHFTDEEREQFKIKATHKWKQQGNLLICFCELGEHATTIPTDKLLVGTDANGAPVLTEVVISQ